MTPSRTIEEQPAPDGADLERGSAMDFSTTSEVTSDDVAAAPAARTSKTVDARAFEVKTDSSRDALLTDALLVEEDIEEHKPADDLVAVDGMDEATAFALAQHGIITRENLADLATDELMEFTIDGVDEDKARTLIMAAREATS